MPTALSPFQVFRSPMFKAPYGALKKATDVLTAQGTPSMGYSGPRLTWDIPATKNVSRLHEALAGQTAQQLSNLENIGGKWYRRAPFLWGDARIPLTHTKTMDEIVRSSASPGQSRAFLEGIMGRHKVYPAVDPMNIVEFQSRLANDLSALPGKNPRQVVLRGGPTLFSKGSYYDTIRDSINVGKRNPETLWHEMGHKVDMSNRLKAALTHGGRYAHSGLRYAVPAALLFGKHIKNIVPGTVDDKVVSALETVGPEAYLGAYGMYKIRPELAATRFANAKIRAAMAGKGGQLKIPKDMGKAMIRKSNWGLGKYTLAGMIPYAVLAAARHFKNKGDKMEKKSGVASQMLMPYVRTAYHPVRQLGAIAGNPRAVLGSVGAPSASKLISMLRRMKNPAKEVILDYAIPTGIGLGALTLASKGYRKAQEESPDVPVEELDRASKILSNPYLRTMVAGYTNPLAVISGGAFNRSYKAAKNLGADYFLEEVLGS